MDWNEAKNRWHGNGILFGFLKFLFYIFRLSVWTSQIQIKFYVILDERPPLNLPTSYPKALPNKKHKKFNLQSEFFAKTTSGNKINPKKHLFTSNLSQQASTGPEWFHGKRRIDAKPSPLLFTFVFCNKSFANFSSFFAAIKFMTFSLIVARKKGNILPTNWFMAHVQVTFSDFHAHIDLMHLKLRRNLIFRLNVWLFFN